MKLPRWLLVLTIALTVLLPVVTAGWWWTQWPQQTAIEYADVLSVRDSAGIQRLMLDAEWLTSQRAFQDLYLYQGSREVTFLKRSVLELFLGRVRFRVGGIAGHFVAERSHVSISDRDRFLTLLHKQGIIASIAEGLEALELEKDNLKSVAAREPKAKDEVDRKLSEIDRQAASRESLKNQFEQELIVLIKNDEASR